MRRQIFGDAERGAPWLQWGVSEHAKGRFGRRVVEDGKVIVEIQPEFVRVIVQGIAGFQAWPRDGDIKIQTVLSDFDDAHEFRVTEFGGTYLGESGASVIYDQSPFPMIFDNVRGTFIAQVSDTTDPKDRSTEAEFNGGYMANCFWTDGKEAILNWRGTPNRHFPVPVGYAIPGVTNGDTPFGTWIYEGGEQLLVAPDGAYVIGAFYKDNILHCVSFLSGQVRVHARVGSEWVQRGQHSGELGLCFISADATRIVLSTGTPGEIGGNGVTWGPSPVVGSGAKSFSWGTGGDVLSVSGSQQNLWAELDDSVIVTTAGSSESSSTRGGSSTTREVPLKTFGAIADGVTVSLDADMVVYKALYGGPPPDGYSIFTARAEPNGRYCSMSWSATAVNGCSGPSEYKLSADGLFAAGHYRVSECNGVNFYMVATTDTGATGRSLNLSNRACVSDSNSQIIQLAPWIFTYSGKIAGTHDPSIKWTVDGATIIGSDSSPVLVLAPPSECVTEVKITVAGLCGRITATFSTGYDPLLDVSVSGTVTPIVGSTYILTNAVGAVTWEFDGGEINSSGTITAITGCGSSTVTGTDSCGSSASMDVRLPTGSWVEIAEYGWDYPCDAISVHSSYELYPSNTTKKLGSAVVVACYGCSCACLASLSNERIDAFVNGFDPDACINSCGCTGSRNVWHFYSLYEWSC